MTKVANLANEMRPTTVGSHSIRMNLSFVAGALCCVNWFLFAEGDNSVNNENPIELYA